MAFPTTNLLAYYKADESSGNAADSSGNGFTLTNTGSLSYVSGKINNGASVRGPATSKYLSRGDILGRTAGNNGNLTIAGWVNLTSFNPGGTLITIRGPGNSPYILWSIGVGSTAAQIWTFTRGRMCVANDTNSVSSTVSTSTWYHLALTWNGTTLTPYVDGVAKTTSAPSGNGDPACGSDITALGDIDGNNPIGIIDEVGFWNRALSSGEISDLYNGGAGLTFPTASGPANVKTFKGLATGSTKTAKGLAINSVKTKKGVA